MAWTVEQQGLLAHSFSYGNNAHRAVIEERLTQFIRFQERLQIRNKRIGGGFIAGFALSIFGPNLFIMHSSALVYLGLGAYLCARLPENASYTEAFNDMLTLYDWCIPDGSQLPPFDNALMQQLVETMGTLVDAERRQRLSPLINGSQAPASIGGYALSGGHALFGAAKAWFGRASHKTAQTIMTPDVFSLLVRQLVQGKSASPWDYYLYGKGRLTLEGYVSKGIALMPTAVKEVFNDSDEATQPKNM